jgi:hypothetical protein
MAFFCYFTIIIEDVILPQLFQPQIFANQILDEYKSQNLPVPPYLNKLKSSRRTILGNSNSRVSIVIIIFPCVLFQLNLK